MEPRLRSQRLWEILERCPRPLLYRIGRAARASVADGTRKQDVIETLCALPEAALERALVEGLARQDLQALCKRIGYASTGSKADLATRIVAAVDDPVVHAPRWRPFAEARAFAHSLELTSYKQWYDFFHGRLPAKGTLPADIPRYPNEAYAKLGWTSWGDFLGTGNPQRRPSAYRPFRQARAYARSLGLADRAEWEALVRTQIGNRRTLPPDIPATPHRVYAGRGWIDYGDWLGTGRIRVPGGQSRRYEEACAFVRALGIRTQTEWHAYCGGELHGHAPRPRDIPSNPQATYHDCGWVSWGEFLGTNTVATFNRAFRSFAAARAYAHKQGLHSRHAWHTWCAAGKLPADIPSRPDKTYAGKGWVNWGDFLGTNTVATFNRAFRSFAAARAYVRKLGLRNRHEWQTWCAGGNRPADIPTRPHVKYAGKGWVSWGDFLGTGNVHPARIRRRSFAAMRAFVRRLGLRSGAEYRAAKRDGRLPADLPVRIENWPEWKGWAEFLGPSFTGRAPTASTRRRRG
jgi:hypothetical protein